MVPIHIAYALDDRFAEMTCASMVSVLMNTKDEVIFHIIESRLSAEHITKIKCLVNEYSHGACKFYHINIDDTTYITTAATKVTKETYAKTMLPDLLAGLDRVLWLDGDTVVEEDIAQLWNIDLDGCCAAMAPDTSFAPKEPKKAVLGISGWYLNTGVILMNLSMLRNMKLDALVESNLPIIHKAVLDAGLVWYAEQDMLNYLLKGQIKRLPIRFNSYVWESDFDGLTLSEVADAFGRPVIIHYIGAYKPTQITRKLFSSPQWYRYFHYKSLTPYADVNDVALVEHYKIRRNYLMDSLLLPDDTHYRLLIKYLKKEIFERTYASIVGNIGNKKLVIWGYNDVTAYLVAFLAGKGLTVIDVVDGVPANLEYSVFGKQIKPASTLCGGYGEYYVLLDMRSKSVADEVVETLKSYGYREDSFHYLYQCFCTY